MSKGRVLVVDDNDGIRAALKVLLTKHFEAVELIGSPNLILTKLKTFRPDVVLLDMNFQASINTGNEGLYWFKEIRRTDSHTKVVFITAYADVELAVKGMQLGAVDFITKPWDNDRLLHTLQTVCQSAAHEEQTGATEMYWGKGIAMQQLHRTVEKIAPTDASVLITGENGTGKDVLANELHRLSNRASKPMVCVDLGALTETLFESELFGHVKGAFTDAHTDHVGKIEQANGGTLFLDEIGNIPLHLQAKLLRVLQNRSVTKVGDSRATTVDIRLICATNRNLEDMVRLGDFREDLYYRINTMHLHLPALRERQDEIVPLAERFVQQYAAKYRRVVKGLSPDAGQLLEDCAWQGNIRELKNCMEKAVILSDGEWLEAVQLDVPRRTPSVELDIPEEETLEMAEERTIRTAMERYGGNLTQVAKSLDISRPTLYAKLKKYNI